MSRNGPDEKSTILICNLNVNLKSLFTTLNTGGIQRRLLITVHFDFLENAIKNSGLKISQFIVVLITFKENSLLLRM